MAQCEDCRLEMTTAETCTFTHVQIDAVLYRRLWYGTERPDFGAKKGLRCGDCGVAPGGTHHAGCDIERCPRCRGQAFTCGCSQMVWCFNPEEIKRLKR